jgi:hypothetical protein
MLKKILLGATFLAAAGMVNAATIEQEFDIPVQATNFDTSISFDEFDDMGGTRILNSVTFSIDGSVFGQASVESLDAAPATIVATLAATLTLTDQNMNELVVTIPSITNMFEATAFDGTIDFAGTSGIEFPDLSGTQFESETYTDGAVLASFIGSGTQMFGFDAVATSSATGAGNIITQFGSQAGGLVKVIYDYTEVPVNVSAPSHIAMLGFGLLAFAGMRKVRK